MKILSIETSCDETAVSILEANGDDNNASFKVLGNALYSQAKKHAVFGGVYPSLAKREHAANLVPILNTALLKANSSNIEENTLSKEQLTFLKTLLSREEDLYKTLTVFLQQTQKPKIDAIAVTQGPGLEPALWVGINFARALSYVWNLPIIPVNHLEGHMIASAVKTDEKNKNYFTLTNATFPILGLIISGGHTEFVYSKQWGDYTIIGKTRDDSIGEAFDKVARMLGIPYPGGPEISRLAELGRNTLRTQPAHHTKDIKRLPRPMTKKTDDLDFSFSGLKTAVLYQVQSIESAGKLTEIQRNLFAAEFEEAVSDVILKKTKSALEKYPAITFALGGGVSANKYIRKRLIKFFKENNTDCTLRLPASGLSTDNAIMIGMAGYFMHLRNAPTLQATDNLDASGNMQM